MPRAQLCRFAGSQAIDFSAFEPGFVGVLLEFASVEGERLALTITDACADQLALQLDALLDDIANKRGGLPITPELWDLHPQILADPSEPTPLFAKGDPDEDSQTDAPQAEAADPPAAPAPRP